jgi:hypothetical protein
MTHHKPSLVEPRRAAATLRVGMGLACAKGSGEYGKLVAYANLGRRRGGRRMVQFKMQSVTRALIWNWTSAGGLNVSP